ncbi:MAG: hypothetical protein AAB465_02120 [Patescibacteria group bacterium]
MTKKKGIRLIANLPSLDISRINVISHKCYPVFACLPSNKMYLALVYLEVKPSTFFHFAPSHLYQPEFSCFLRNFCQILKKLGLCYGFGLCQQFPIDHSRKSSLVALYVAIDQKSLIRVMTAETEREFGLALGFPETAVKAFCEDPGYTRTWSGDKEEKIIYYSLPRRLREIFGWGYVMSKENWQEEIKILKKWYQTLRQDAPILFRQFDEFSKTGTVKTHKQTF